MEHNFLEVALNVPLFQNFTYANLPEYKDIDLFGCRVMVSFGRRQMTGRVVNTLSELKEPIDNIKTITKVVETEALFSKEYLALAKWISEFYLCTLGEALSVMLPGAKREKSILYDTPESTEETPHIILSDEQARAIQSIFDAREGLFYLYGVTGSGKTEVFLRCAERVIKEGKTVIYLVPEISLTHQLVEHTMNRFKGRLALIHSNLTPSQRLKEWRRIQNGEVDMVMGVRSAVFAPIDNIGLIILDEEHESSYKSGTKPRYHARQIAMKRVADNHALFLMGSATPSLEAWRLIQEGTIGSFTLAQRVAGGAMPQVEVIDMCRISTAFSPRLIEEVNRTKEEGRQTILFLNRRGFSHFFVCRTCGFELKCRKCSVPLTYHKSKDTVMCHYCGYRARPRKDCPECGSLDVGYYSFGTEWVEEEARRIFSHLKIARIDTDVTRKKDEMKRILTEFRDGKIDILLGTQMIAKGLNFPSVKLVGVVLADTTLNLPDFRAQERAFSLIMQVAGRAGRYSPDGKVIVQTFRPQNNAIIASAQDDLPRFFKEELAVRKAQFFPPYSRIIRLVFRGHDKNSVINMSSVVAEEFIKTAGSYFNILGPSECPIAKISNNYRYQLLLRTTSFDYLHREVKRVTATIKRDNKVFIEIDIDPVSMM